MKLIANSATKQGIIKLICDFYIGSAISLIESTEPLTWKVHNRKGEIKDVAVVLIKGRYKFISLC
jgi:hypothetical protein